MQPQGRSVGRVAVLLHRFAPLGLLGGWGMGGKAPQPPSPIPHPPSKAMQHRNACPSYLQAAVLRQEPNRVGPVGPTAG